MLSVVAGVSWITGRCAAVLGTGASYLNLPRRGARCRVRFAGYPTYLVFGDPALLTYLLHIGTPEQQTNTALGDDGGCIVVCMVCVIAALANKLSLAQPVVWMSVAAWGTLLRRIEGRYFDHEFARPAGFVAQILF